jgi:hypothetical protein
MPGLLTIVLASSLTSSQILLVADRVPDLNIEPSCHAAAAAVIGNRNEETCKRDENDARGKLEQEWGQFSAVQQTHCVNLSTLGGPPSYVELLTCLEMAKAASARPTAVKPPDAKK